MNRMLPFLLLFALAAFSAAADSPRQRTVVIAHRANHERFPENSLEAIRAAIEIGADFVELDVRRTKDKRHVLSHDRSLQRMTGVARNVDELTLLEVKALTLIGSDGKTDRRVKVPTFEEALDVIGQRIGLYLDFKEGDPTEIVAELQRRQQLKKVIVYLPAERISAWPKTDPTIRFIVSLPDNDHSPEGVKRFVQKYPAVVLDGDVTDYSAALVSTAHQLGVLVWPDIQNPNESPEQWSKALALGVDGLQTDHPSALIAWLKSVGRR